MNSPERASRPVFGPPAAPQRLHRVPTMAAGATASPSDRGAPPAPGLASRPLSGFSVARIYSTFHLRRAEHFPEELGDAAFELLIDIFQHEWLNRRVGSQADSGMHLADADMVPSGLDDLIDANLVTITPVKNPEGPLSLVRLSPLGRARLNIFLEAMASYISRA